MSGASNMSVEHSVECLGSMVSEMGTSDPVWISFSYSFQWEEILPIQVEN